MTGKAGIALFILSVTSALLLGAAKPASAEGVAAATIAQHLDRGKYSSTEIKSYLKDLKGKEVSAHGRVSEVLTMRGSTRVVVFIDAPGKRNFIVDVYVKDGASFRKNDRVTCTGEFSKANMFTLNGIAIKGSCKK